MVVDQMLADFAVTQEALSTIAALLSLTSYRFPVAEDVPDFSIYDYIVCGGGSAGNVVANRLTEDPNVSVLLIDAGGDPPLDSVLPGLAPYLVKSQYDFNFTTQTDENVFECSQNNQMHLSTGKVLGGGSSINHMYYVRGDPHDFNVWAEKTNDQSWNYTNVLQYFKKSERLVDEDIPYSTYRDYHGYDGYLGVTRPHNEITRSILDSAKEAGYNVFLDANGDYRIGFSEQMFTIADGIRQSTASAFLIPIKDRKNLHVMKNSLVTKINIDENNVARGVNVLDNNQQTITVKARKEVILSTGSFNTAKLLILSGVGPRKTLEKYGIEVVADLPVGEQILARFVTPLYVKTSRAVDKPQPANPHAFDVSGVTGYLALNESQGFTDHQVILQSSDPESAIFFCVTMFSFNKEICEKLYNEIKGNRAVSIFIFDYSSKPRGKITIRSTNPEDAPLIHLYPFDDEDINNYIHFIEDTKRILNTTYFRNMNAKLVPLEKCAVFGEGTTEYWTCYVQCLRATSFHYSGTCAMGKVVDSRLRVYGVDRLRVVDASVMPTISSGNIMAAVIMVGEKGSDMIKEDNRSRA